MQQLWASIVALGIIVGVIVGCAAAGTALAALAFKICSIVWHSII